MADDILQRINTLIAHEEEVDADGGYAAGDGPPFPMEELKAAAARITELEEALRRAEPTEEPDS